MSRPSEREKMLAGEMYNPMDPELVELRQRARRLFRKFNQTPDEAIAERKAILAELFDESPNVPWLEMPFFCDYGRFIKWGKNCFMNFDCVILDVCPVEIGDNFMAAPKVQILTATHPVDATERIAGLEYGKPVKIGNNVWVGAGAIILPGVTIGDNVTVGAGAVVTKDVPANVVVAGNPARVIRHI
jgi:maltose O-acetyltransferase